jgi:hypothetical protein
MAMYIEHCHLLNCNIDPEDESSMFLPIFATDFLTARRRNPQDGSFNALGDHRLCVKR